ncbi:fructose-bisphosphate aldolase [Frigoribacterium sp. Leaf263]|uniref:class II fructose-bisphosphate aldolase n=1 Tax=Frigoribacterium sp. Leaf263 TaxID=1736313 RepID=UPI0006FD1559|nr:class II fructose-bisphosphate aldolase [Frigoribacterium sp. Leaf263]KQO80433.1 fructose-bisphosphate aldolase [Frigoribacterium sp. Leaf263]
MTLVTTRGLIEGAITRRSAIASFNVVTLEHIEAITEGVEQAGSGAILQVSENAIGFHKGDMRPLLLACASIASSSSAPISLHLDHFQDSSLISQGIDEAAGLGVSSIMIDAAHHPYVSNIELTLDAAQRAHSHGLWVEGELGEIGGKNGAHSPLVRTDPGEAREYVAGTSIDALAVAVGSSHAMTSASASIDVDLIGRLEEAVGVPLVLHGSSGVSDTTLRAAVSAGIRKINVGTALNVAFTDAVRQRLFDESDVHDPRIYIADGRDAISRTVTRICRLVAESADEHRPALPVVSNANRF